jgi:hypothetical protein
MIVLHHPPYYFQSHKWTELTGARLLNRRALQIVLNQNNFRFHIIAGGHRHLVDPPESECPLPIAGSTQLPLPDGIVQLAAGSATQRVSKNKDRPSFSLYNVIIDEKSGLLSIERTIYKHVSNLVDKFTPGPTHLVKELPLF